MGMNENGVSQNVRRQSARIHQTIKSDVIGQWREKKRAFSRTTPPERVLSKRNFVPVDLARAAARRRRARGQMQVQWEITLDSG